MNIKDPGSASIGDRAAIHPPLPAKGKYIRVVNILPGNGTDASGVCLEFVSRPVSIAADKPSHGYEALSYVWGEENNKIDIKFKRQNETGAFALSAFPVTRNLFEAILHLRHEEVPRSVWIDAICINQEDNTEKNHQVLMMGDVYKKASKVVVWLGPSTGPADSSGGSNLAMRVIEKTGRDIRHDWDVGFSVLAGAHNYAYASRTEWHMSVTAPKQPLLYNKDEAWAICELLRRPWFHRLWIRQEIKMAIDHGRDAVVQCGNVCVSWKALSCTVAYARRNWWSTGFIRWPREYDRLAFVFDLCHTTTQGCDLPSLHGATRRAGCKNPRDKIYGVMNICQDLYSLGIAPDYDCLVADLYKEVVVKYISTFRSLDIFAAVHFNEHCNDNNLPSWVPDWGSYGNRNDIPKPWPRFYNYFAVQELSQGTEGLAISGLSIGAVRKVWPLYEGLHIEYSQSMIDIWRDGIRTIHDRDQLTQVHEERLIEAFCHTLCFGKEEPHLNLSDTRTDLEEGKRNGYNLRWILAENTAIRCMHRQFFITDTGRMGVGPSTTQPGDKVASFLGSAMPFVITPCRTTPLGCPYRLRGGCYVDGAMALEPFLGALPGAMVPFWKDGPLYMKESRTPEHGFKDPRLERLAAFEGYREWLDRGPSRSLMSTTTEQWQRIGVNIERFSLI